ncbi:MAG: nitroreductase [Chloroflexi bacterium]|nr:nitroreductase [Chloroflexota bacterium]
MSVAISSYLEAFASKWYSVITKRRSRRQFDVARPVSPDLLSQLKSVCVGFRPFPNARAELVTESSGKIFKGVVGAFGKVKDAPAFIAFIGNMESPRVQEEVGYTGEGIILEATALGLDTCWVAGFFRPDSAAALVDTAESERVLAVTPIGYASKNESLEEKVLTRFGRNHRRKLLASLISGLPEKHWPEWVKVSLEAARLAPSAVNRQPWGFHVEPDSITVFVRTSGPDFNVSKRLDCGIAMLHIEVAAMTCGFHGEWNFLNSSQVARFTVRGKA